jgi:hypothetical protein
MAYPTITYTLNNGDTADASRLMTNFNDILAGMSDGSKDHSINALTVAGAATLNGNVALGNATSDDLSANGYWATSMVPKTTAVYGLGTDSLKWGSLYVSGTASLDGAVTINESGANVDFRVEGDTKPNLFFVDASSDYIGINSSSPESLLSIYGTESILTIQRSSQAVGQYASVFCYTSGAGGFRIGLLNNSAEFQVANDANTKWLGINKTSGMVSLPGVYAYTSANPGNVFVDTDGTLIRYSSSEKYKTNIVSYKKGLGDLLKLNPISFQDKNPKYSDKVFAGFSAESLHKDGFNEFVQYGSDGEPEGVGYQAMVALLTNAIKEQAQKIKTLEQKIFGESLSYA